MRRSWKICTAAVLIAMIAAVVFLARQNLRLNGEVESLAIKAEAMAEGLDRLTRERGHTFPRLLDPTVGGKSEPATLELARLRAEVARLTALTNELTKQLLATKIRQLGSSRVTNSVDISIQPSSPLTEEQLTASQKLAFHQLEKEVARGNSIADIDRLKDTLTRWDELWVKDAPDEVKPVFTLLKETVRERIELLEKAKAEEEKLAH